MIQFDSNIFPKIEGAYIIGGSVRDLLLGLSPIDYDITVSGNPEKLAKKLAVRTNGHLVEMGKPGQMIIRVVSDDYIFDISSFSGTSIEEDLNQRDFTVNAMAYALRSGEVTDCTGGLRDLADKKIRMVSKNIFKKDPARLIRAYRMSACLDFEIEPHTVAAIRKDAKLIQHTAGERIRLELFKILRSPKSHDYLFQMADTQLLTAIFPELARLHGCFQNKHHRYDVFEHSMKAYYHLETILNDCSQLLPNTHCHMTKSIDENRAILLKCAILLHDIGKPSKRTIDIKGDAHFIGHSQKSADLAQNICKRLKFSTREKDFIDLIIRNHMKPLFLFLAHQNNTLTPQGQARFYMKYGQNTPYLLLHSIADILGKSNNNKNEACVMFIKNMLHDFFSDYLHRSNEPPLITGHDLIHAFGLTPSPIFKTILNLVKEASLSNQITNKKEALTLVKAFLNSKT